MALPVTLILSLPLIFLLLALLILPAKQHPRPLPPGPRPWPVVGNLVHLVLLHRRQRRPPHVLLAALARAHGPVLHLRLGARPLVVASSPSAAAAVLRLHDRELSGRHVPAAFRISEYLDYSLAFAPRSDGRWKSLRALCKEGIFSTGVVEAFTAVRERKAREMVEFLLSREGVEVGIGELVFRTILNTLGSMLFSRDDVLDIPAEEEEEEEEKKKGGGKSWNMKKAIAKNMELGMKPNLEDFYPAVFGGLDPQGLRRECQKNLDKLNEVWDGIIRERRREMEKDGGRGQLCGEKVDFLKLMLCSELEDLQIRALFLDIFTAGTDTTSNLIEWIMAELVKNPDVMERVRDELGRVIGPPGQGSGGGIIRESHLPDLTYLQACIKETLRLHPPVPLLLPRHADMDTCEVMSYKVPNGSIVGVNVWAIGRDPEVWEDPLRFSPERFLGQGAVDYKGMDFEFVPFGAGRRICPGLPLAARTVQLVVASLVHGFDWSLPGGMEPQQLNMSEKFGLILEREQPLVLIPKSLDGGGRCHS